MDGEGEGDAEEGADEYFEGGVAQEFPEAFREVFGMVLVEVLSHPVENAGHLARRLANTGGIVHDDQGNPKGDGKFHRRKAADQPRAGGQRTHGGAVAAGHAARLHQETKVQPMLKDNVTDELDKLGQKAAGKARNNNFNTGAGKLC